MASEAWIESASRDDPKPPGGDGFIDRKAHHYLSGAFTAAPGEVGAARLLAREDREICGWFGLPAVPVDAASPLVGLVQRGDMAAARALIGGLTRQEIAAVRAALKARRTDA